MVENSRGTGRGWWQETPTGLAQTDRFPRTWVFIASFVLLAQVIPTLTHLATASEPTWQAATVLVLLAGYSAGYLCLPLVLPHERFAARLGYGLGMLVAGFALFAVAGNVVYTLIYALAAVAFVLPAGWAMLLDSAGLVVAGLWLLADGRFDTAFGDLLTVASVTVALFFMGRLLRAVRALRQAQAEVATLAATAERERLARDLHDVLGHSLTTITVKSGLVRRMLESGPDTDRAIEEVRVVEGLARGALTEVRATVSAYREVSLSAELVGARAALRAAQIRADLPQAVDEVRDDLRPTFGYVLREAVTNAVRHSGADRVAVRWGPTWIEVSNDGPSLDGHRVGNGLRGLSERLAEVGGVLEARPHAEGGFLLRAEITGGEDG